MNYRKPGVTTRRPWTFVLHTQQSKCARMLHFYTNIFLLTICSTLLG